MASLYRKIARSLIDLIKLNELNVGDKMPTEARLMEQYNASRNTIRESLRELEMLGYTRRRRGTRSIVIEKKPEEKISIEKKDSKNEIKKEVVKPRENSKESLSKKDNKLPHKPNKFVRKERNHNQDNRNRYKE